MTRLHHDAHRYHERRGLTGDYYWILLVSLGVVGFAAFESVTTPPASISRRLTAWLLLLAGLAFLNGMFFSRYGPELKHVTVDDRGVWVRRHLLPAQQIDKVWEITSQTKAAGIHFSSSIDGNHLLRGICSYSFFAGARTAVYVEQRREGQKPRPWLIGTDHPRQLATTIRQLRADAGGPLHHPDDKPAPDEAVEPPRRGAPSPDPDAEQPR